MKYYFSKTMGEERCHTKADIIDYMKMNHINEMEVNEAQIEVGTSYFYCRYYDEVGEVGESCGKVCGKYKPRNGKNGRCIYSDNCYIPTDKTIILKLKEETP